LLGGLTKTEFFLLLCLWLFSMALGLRALHHHFSQLLAIYVFLGSTGLCIFIGLFWWNKPKK